jgi:hypothetical protein
MCRRIGAPLKKQNPAHKRDFPWERLPALQVAATLYESRDPAERRRSFQSLSIKYELCFVQDAPQKLQLTSELRAYIDYIRNHSLRETSISLVSCIHFC